jgi:LemA protein
MTTSFVSRFGRIVLVSGAAISLAGCGLNSVPTAEENVNAKFGDIQAQLQRRSDLVPNLVETVKAAAASESQILTNVTQARAAATSINITTEDLSDPAVFEKFQASQNQLTQALGQLRTVVENYPALQSQGRYSELMAELSGTENRLNEARLKYNGAVQEYNTTIRTFPDAIGAKIFYGAKPKLQFAAEAAAQSAPKVNFGTGPAAAPAGANDNAAKPAAPAASSAATN